MSLHKRLLRGLSLGVVTALVALLASTGLIEAQTKKAEKQALKQAVREAIKPVALAVPAGKLDPVAIARLIDQGVQAKLKAEGITASGRTDDAEFLRRVYLDLVGKVPTADAARKFLESTDPDKRAKLVDELLASKDYGVHQSDIWSTLLIPKNSDNRRLNPEPLVKWLEKHFNDNTPWDKLATQILTAAGPQDENAAVTFFLANNSVDKMTDSVGKVFMGLQLQCAQCHPHPFTEWSQKQYWETAAFFLRVQPGNVNAAAKTGASPGVIEAPKAKTGKNALPESAKIVPPKTLDGFEPKIVGTEPLRPHLAQWLCTPDNKFFAKAMVNRVWAQLFARGFVNPIDDIRDENEPSHPELFNALSQQFARNGFDLKALYKAICLSETYQSSSKPNDSNRGTDPTLFARMNVKTLSPEQLYDSLQVVLGDSRPERTKNAATTNKGPNVSAKTNFVNFFNLDENWDPMEFQAGIPQVLRLMNSAAMNNVNRATELTRDSKTPADAIEKLYLSALSRRPTEVEQARAQAHVKKVVDTKQAYADLLWVLVNTSEFSLNR